MMTIPIVYIHFLHSIIVFSFLIATSMSKSVSKNIEAWKQYVESREAEFVVYYTQGERYYLVSKSSYRLIPSLEVAVELGWQVQDPVIIPNGIDFKKGKAIPSLDSYTKDLKGLELHSKFVSILYLCIPVCVYIIKTIRSRICLYE